MQYQALFVIFCLVIMGVVFKVSVKNLEKGPKAKRSKSDFKFNIISVLSLLSGIFLFVFAEYKSKTILSSVEVYYEAGGIMILISFFSALIAMARNEPREPLTYMPLVLYGFILCYLLFALIIITVLGISF